MTNNDNKEKRSHERVDFDHSIVVYKENTNVSIGTLVNISENGLMLFGAPGVVEGNLYPVTIALSSTTVLEMTLECLWISDADSEDKVWSGYVIDQISEEEQDLLNLTVTELLN